MISELLTCLKVIWLGPGLVLIGSVLMRISTFVGYLLPMLFILNMFFLSE